MSDEIKNGLGSLPGAIILRMREKFLNIFLGLCESYIIEINQYPARSSYNATFKTYGISQRDVKQAYKVRFQESSAMCEFWGVDIEKFKSIIPDTDDTRSGPMGDGA